MRAYSTVQRAAVALIICAAFPRAQDSTGSASPGSPERSYEIHPPRTPPPVVIDGPTALAPVATDTSTASRAPAASKQPDSATATDSTKAQIPPPAIHGGRFHALPPPPPPAVPAQPAQASPATDSAAPLASASGPEGGPVDTEVDEDKALEIKLKTDPEAARRYRSPRKAFFLSLVLPGAGQVYCGSYVKAGLFAATEIGLGFAWWKVAIVRSRQKEREAERFAAEHWRQQRYEETWGALMTDSNTVSNPMRSAAAPSRQSYCDALYGAGSSSPADSACWDGARSQYSLHSAQFSVGGTTSTAAGAWSTDSVQSYWSRNIKDLGSFYDLIGRYDEFAVGWEDNNAAPTAADVQAYYNLVVDSDPSTVPAKIWGTSSYRQSYLAMRSRADQLARMQKWFLGGMILNHLAAAFDAALQASRMNRSLLELQTSWLDHLGVEGGLAFASSSPTLHARLDWSF